MSTILKFKKAEQKDIQTEESILSSEDFEFWEDMISLSDMAIESEIDCVCFDDPSHVVTKNGEIKLNPLMKDTYHYIKNKSKQKSQEFKQVLNKGQLRLVD